MPKCCWRECKRDLPELRMVVVTEYEREQGSFWYFCSWWHLMSWLEERFMKRGDTTKDGLSDSKAYLGRVSSASPRFKK